MARKSFVELSNDLLTSFPDNIAGAITPLVLRTYFQNFLDAIRPAYGLISRTAPVVQTFGLTDAPVVFDTGVVSGVPDYTVTQATGTITRLAAGSTRLTFSASAEGANGRLVSFTLYKNGTPTSWRTSATLQGAGKPVDTTLVAAIYEGSQAIYQLQAKTDVASTGVTLSNMDMLAETVPVNSY
jgi:hypothetical protein